MTGRQNYIAGYAGYKPGEKWKFGGRDSGGSTELRYNNVGQLISHQQERQQHHEQLMNSDQAQYAAAYGQPNGVRVMDQQVTRQTHGAGNQQGHQGTNGDGTDGPYRCPTCGSRSRTPINLNSKGEHEHHHDHRPNFNPEQSLSVQGGECVAAWMLDLDQITLHETSQQPKPITLNINATTPTTNRANPVLSLNLTNNSGRDDLSSSSSSHRRLFLAVLSEPSVVPSDPQPTAQEEEETEQVEEEKDNKIDKRQQQNMSQQQVHFDMQNGGDVPGAQQQHESVSSVLGNIGAQQQQQMEYVQQQQHYPQEQQQHHPQQQQQHQQQQRNQQRQQQQHNGPPFGTSVDQRQQQPDRLQGYVEHHKGAEKFGNDPSNPFHGLQGRNMFTQPGTRVAQNAVGGVRGPRMLQNFHVRDVPAPGFTGHIPGMKENDFGKSYAAAAEECKYNMLSKKFGQR